MITLYIFVLSQTTCQACREGGQTVLKLCQILCESTGNTRRSSSRWRRRERRTGRRRRRVEEQRGLKCVIITANYSRAYYTKYSQTLAFSLSLSRSFFPLSSLTCYANIAISLALLVCRQFVQNLHKFRA